MTPADIFFPPRSLAAIAITLVTASAESIAMPQEYSPEIAAERIRARADEFAIHVRGANDPTAIPFSARMRSLLKNFDSFAPNLEGSISEHGMSILLLAADAEPIDSKYDNVASDQIWNDICSNLNEMEAPAIAQKVVDVATQFQQRRESRYSTWLNQLSSHDLQSLEIFLNDVVVRSINMSDSDAIALATAMPVEYKIQIQELCKSRAHPRSDKHVDVLEDGTTSQGVVIERSSEQ